MDRVRGRPVGGGGPPEHVAHPGRQARDRAPGHRSGHRLEPQVPPVRELPCGEHAGHLVGLPRRKVLDLAGPDPVDGQDEVGATQRRLPLAEPAELGATGLAAEQAGRHDDQQQGGAVQRPVDALLPVLPPGDVVAVLEDRELGAGLCADLGGEPVAELADQSVVVAVVEPDVAQERSGHRPSFAHDGQGCYPAPVRGRRGRLRGRGRARPTTRHAHGGFVWLGMFEPAPDELARVRDCFGLHELAVEDAQTFHMRPKVESYDGEVRLVILRTARCDDPAEEVEFGEISVFLSRSSSSRCDRG